MTVVAELAAVLALRPDKASFDKGSALIGGLHSALGAFLGVEVIKKLGEMVMSTIDTGGHLDDLRQQTGLSAVALQEYAYAAKLGGVDLDTFAHGVGKLAKTFEAAKGGSKEATAALAKVGMTGQTLHEALTGGSDGLDKGLMRIADTFADMPDGPKKTALAMELFGRAGAQLIPTLNRGGDGLRELKQEALDMGAIMSEDAVSAADELGDNIDKLKMSLTGLKNQAIGGLLPVLKEAVDGLMAWIKANREAIASTLAGAVSILIDVFSYLGKVIGVVFEFFEEHPQIAKAMLIALGIVVGALAAQMLAMWVVAKAAFLAPILLITALILLVQDLWAGLTEGKGVIAAVAKFLADKFKSAGDKIVSAFKAVGRFFADIASSIKGFFVDAFDWIVEKAKDVGGFIRNLPVLKQVIDAGVFIHDKLTDDGSTVPPPPSVPADATSYYKPSGGPGGAATTNTYGDIYVTSPSSDPQAVAMEVRKQIDDHWSMQMRHGLAGTGADEAVG